MRADERVSLAGTPMLVGVAFAVGALVCAVLPTAEEYEQGTDNLPHEAYSTAYLEMLTRANPGDAHTRIAFVRHLLALGEFEAAWNAIREPFGGGRHAADIADLRFDVMLAYARSIPDGQTRDTAFASVVTQLETLRPSQHTVSRLRELAKVALELERPRLAADFLFELARRHRDDSPKARVAEDRASVLVEAGRWMHAAHDGVRGAACLREAAAIEGHPARARTFALEAASMLEAADRVVEAADLVASYAGRHPDDEGLVERAADLAMSANRPVIARDFGRLLLALRANDDQEIERQARRELLAGDPVAALPLVRRAVEKHPNDVDWRVAEAHVAEWAGDPPLALQDWLWLFDRGVTSSRPFIALP